MAMNSAIKEATGWDIPKFKLRDTVSTVIDGLANWKSCSVIVEENNTVYGVVSGTDLINPILKGGDLSQLTVADVMTPCELIDGDGTNHPCAQIDEDETIENTLKVFEASGTHCLIVSSSEKKRVGVAALRDVLLHAVK